MNKKPRKIDHFLSACVAQGSQATLHSLDWLPKEGPKQPEFQSAKKLYIADGNALPPPKPPSQAAKSPLPPALSSSDEEFLASHPDITLEHLTRVMTTVTNVQGTSADDIGGLEDVKEVIRNRIIRPLRRPDLHKGLYEATSGVLLFGPPGTGKTTIARWIASEADATFFSVTPSVLISMFMGESESLIRCLFLRAEHMAPSIIFIDEIDGFLSRRTAKEEEATLRIKNQFLQAMDGISGRAADKPIVLIGATNRPDAIDEAALRRLPKRIYIPLPERKAVVHQIRNILWRHARQLGICCCPDASNDLKRHACHLRDFPLQWVDEELVPRMKGFNGSDIKALCVKAAEIVYQNTLEMYGHDLTAIPGPEVFRLPSIVEFSLALKSVGASSGDAANLAEWASSYGCS